jgi:hypothetical protein
MTLDQANTAAWTSAWTNLVNEAQQTFTPSLLKLTAVEVELVVGDPGSPDDELTMTLLDATGRSLAVVSKTVATADCAHALFVFPNGGAIVTPGQVYVLRLSGSTTFGWKYVEGGYEKGSATFNGRPLLPGARSTFLFRTFGTNASSAELDASEKSARQELNMRAQAQDRAQRNTDFLKQVERPTEPPPRGALSLNRANDGQHFSARVGQPIVVTLQTIGGGQYDTPQISSGAVEFVSAVFPPMQNPGGPTQIYRFIAAAEGDAQIRIPHTGSNPAVTYTIRVTKP